MGRLGKKKKNGTSETGEVKKMAKGKNHDRTRNKHGLTQNRTISWGNRSGMLKANPGWGGGRAGQPTYEGGTGRAQLVMGGEGGVVPPKRGKRRGERSGFIQKTLEEKKGQRQRGEKKENLLSMGRMKRTQCNKVKQLLRGCH